MLTIEGLITKNADRLGWTNASQKIDINQIDENIFHEFVYKWDWVYTSKYQTLYESFIREHRRWVDWHWISIH